MSVRGEGKNSSLLGYVVQITVNPQLENVKTVITAKTSSQVSLAKSRENICSVRTAFLLMNTKWMGIFLPGVIVIAGVKVGGDPLLVLLSTYI